MAVFAVIGALDKVFGNKLKLGDEFEKGLTTLGPLSLSMLGMMTIAPALADLLLPVITPVANLFHFDPSALAGILIANDMGGAALADSVASDEILGQTDGIDFEKRIWAIYQECRTDKEIAAAFESCLEKESRISLCAKPMSAHCSFSNGVLD